jgi:nucleotide-binding universal stress UspA family protein
MTNAINVASALDDFYKARRRAQLQDIAAALRGESSRLLSYEDVRTRLQAVESSRRYLADILLESIVGSVGRYNDFTRTFLPKNNSAKQRWVNVEVQMTGLEGLPPIDVYQLGDVYFVKDGNHRVSVARQLGFAYIQAYVTPVQSRVPLDASLTAETLIVKEEYVRFLELTQLDKTRPQADLSELNVTAAGRYDELLTHIRAHRYFMALERRQPDDPEGHVPLERISLADAAADWYDCVFTPTSRIITDRLLEHFDNRTKADLYLWLSNHHRALEEHLGWHVPQDVAASDLLSHFSKRTQQPQRPAFANQHAPRNRDRLIQRVMVPLSDTAASWRALEQGLIVAAREKATLYGLHVLTPDASAGDKEHVSTIQRRFFERCRASGIEGQFASLEGYVVDAICERSRHMDVVIAAIPPGKNTAPNDALSGSQALLRCSHVPLLTMRGSPYRIKRALLAYDGSPQADTALYAAAYLADRWDVKVVVMTVLEANLTKSTSDALDQAKSYLEQQGINATFWQARGKVSDGILHAAQVHQSDLILLGNYRYNPLVEPLLGGVLDQLLRRSTVPLLVCK